MARKRFKARQPATMQEAIRLCLDYAEHEHNRSVALQRVLNEAVVLLTRYYADDADAAEVLQGVTSALQRLAWHRENVRRVEAPELELFEEDAE